MNSAIRERERLMDLQVIGPTRAHSAFDRIRAQATMLVPGVGNWMAQIAIVGEGPGAVEDRTGLPFVGPAGELLTRLLVSAHTNRTTCWVTNLMKYRCTNSQGTDRRPYRTENVAARPFLAQELNIINPRVVVLCGATAINAVLPSLTSVSRAIGEPFESPRRPGRTYLPVRHPAAVLRSEDESTDAIWEHFALIPRLAARPVPEVREH